MTKETNEEKKSILENAILEYTQILEVAKSKIAESHSKELDEMVTKLLKENDISQYKEPVTVKEESQLEEMTNEESTSVDENVEAIDMKEASLKEIEEAFDAASDDDEFKVVKSDDNNGEDFSLSDIEGEISEVMSEIEAAENSEIENVVEPEVEVDNLTKIKQIHEEMGKMIEAMDAEKNDLAMKEEFHNKMTETFGEGYEEKLGMDECGKMYETWKGKMNETSEAAPIAESEAGTAIPKTNKTGIKGTFTPNAAAKQGSIQTKAVEKPIKIAEDEVSEEAEQVAEEVVDETHGVGLSANKLVGGTNAPQLDHKDYAKDKVRLALQKEQNEKLQKRINSLVKENFELTKKANKADSVVKEMTKINEAYKNAIDKYRKQLNEMALVSTNIANVNNILVNESLALSFDDKKNMINEFKKVSTVEESENTYKKIVKEFTEAKKTIKESVEDKISKSTIAPSSSNEVNESLEPKNEINEHIEKIKKLSVYKPKN